MIHYEEGTEFSEKSMYMGDIIIIEWGNLIKMRRRSLESGTNTQIVGG